MKPDELKRLTAYDEAVDERDRRLSRYDEAVELLRELTSYQPLSDSDDGYIVAHEKVLTFLAEEPK